MSDRHFYRLNFTTKAKVMLPDVCFDAMTENLSAGGMFVSTDYPLPVGRVVTINFKIPSPSHPSITVKSEVVRQNSKGLAFHFLDLGYDSFLHLTSAIKKRPLPDLLDS